MLERLELIRVEELLATILRTPHVERRAADADLASEVGYRDLGLELLEHPVHLLLPEPQSLHHPFPALCFPHFGPFLGKVGRLELYLSGRAEGYEDIEVFEGSEGVHPQAGGRRNFGDVHLPHSRG